MLNLNTAWCLWRYTALFTMWPRLVSCNIPRWLKAPQSLLLVGNISSHKNRRWVAAHGSWRGWRRRRRRRGHGCFMELGHFFTFPHRLGDKLTRKEEHRTYWSVAKSRTEPLRLSNPKGEDRRIGTSPLWVWRTPGGSFVFGLTGPLSASLQSTLPVPKPMLSAQVFHFCPS